MLGFFFVALLLAALVNAYSPGNCTGDCSALDPTVIQRFIDGKYFRFSTGGNIAVTTADSLQGPWKTTGNALTNGSKIHIDGVDSSNLWAPDVHYIGGIYYMYYAISTSSKSTSAIGVASSVTMEPETWFDHGSIGVGSDNASDYNAIDANWISIDGIPYMNFGSYYSGIQQVELLDPLTRKNSSHPYQLAFNTTGGNKEEGSFMFEHLGDYFLLFSSGINVYPKGNKAPKGEEYRIVMCRSQNGTGAFVDGNGVSCRRSGGSTLLASDGSVYGPGGQGVFWDAKMGLVLYYHYANENIGLSRAQFQFGWNHLCFTKDNWPFVCEPSAGKPQLPDLAKNATSTPHHHTHRSQHRGFWVFGKKQ